MLHDPARHEALRGEAWSEAAARAGIERIVADVVARFDAATLWPLHPRELEPGEAEVPQPTLYNGAAGVVWALRALQDDGLATVPLDLGQIAASLEPHALRYIEANASETPSYFLGLGGVELLRWSFSRDAAVADRLHDLIEQNFDNPANEALWGSPGTLIAAIHLAEATAEPRWQALFVRGVERLWATMEPARHTSVRPETDAWLWTPLLYGETRRYLGAGHGFVGNLYPVLRGAAMLEPSVVADFEARAATTLEIAASREPGLVAWEHVFDPEAEGRPRRRLVQDCHGAPGVVCRLASTRHPDLRALLLDAGEAVWQAGPLVKRPGLCHGTDGNGYAFLKLHAATGEPRWLERARSFAMHALAQSDDLAAQYGARVPSLWSGDLGLACFLSSCLRADPRLPALDRF